MRPFRERLYEVVFEADTPAGKLFDLVLIVLIVVSVLAVCLDSVQSIQSGYGHELMVLEWCITIVFTVEYLLRLYAAPRRLAYMTSFFGVIDAVSILPTYLSLLSVDFHYVMLVRVLRLLRLFRVLKLTKFVLESDVLWRALVASRRKIIVFLFTVLTVVVAVGAIMFVIEGPEHGFTSVPVSMYWAIVTLTTVGYGDISPKTPLGQMIASLVMVLGYGIIAVPTGIVTVELASASRPGPVSTQVCPACFCESHDHDAVYCKRCGSAL